MPTTEQLQTWLEEAYLARHKLSTGKLPVSLSHGDRSLTFTQASKGALDAYIAQLRTEIQQAGGKPRRRTYRIAQTGSGL